MATTHAEYAHWQQKNAAAINRIAALETQISKLRQQQVEQQQKQQAMNRLKKAIKSYLLRQEEYKILFQSLGGRSKRTTRDTAHSETSMLTAPETKASIAVNQLRGQIKFILEQNLQNQTCDKKVTSLSEPISALLKSSTVEPQMILEQMSNHLIKFQERANAICAERAEYTGPSFVDAKLIDEQISLCEKREAQSRDNNQHILSLKSKADLLVRQIKSKIAANYPDEEVQRMLLKYILTKAQKDRYSLKLDRLQEKITKMEGELGSEYLSSVAKDTDLTKQIEQKDLINQLSLHIDDLSLNVIQQLEQSKKLGIEDEKRLWNEIEQERLQIQSIFRTQVDILTNESITQQIEKRPENEENEVLRICSQLRLSPNTDMRFILQQVQQLKAQTKLSVDNEAMWIEELGISKNRIQLLGQELVKNALVEDEGAFENVLASLATQYTDHVKQEQDDFWTSLDEKLLSIDKGCKKRAIDVIKQIQICINESNEMLQGELMLNTADQDAVAE